MFLSIMLYSQNTYKIIIIIIITNLIVCIYISSTNFFFLYIFSGICQTDEDVKALIEPLIKPMSESYLEVFDLATNSDTSKKKREFFGLRDFYR